MRHLKSTLTVLISASAILGVGCTERTHFRAFDNEAWAPSVSETGPNTGVTGSSASPYVGGGILNKKPDPAYNPALDHDRVIHHDHVTNDGRVIHEDHADHVDTTTTTIHRDY